MIRQIAIDCAFIISLVILTLAILDFVPSRTSYAIGAGIAIAYQCGASFGNEDQS